MFRKRPEGLQNFNTEKARGGKIARNREDVSHSLYFLNTNYKKTRQGAPKAAVVCTRKEEGETPANQYEEQDHHGK